MISRSVDWKIDYFYYAPHTFIREDVPSICKIFIWQICNLNFSSWLHKTKSWIRAWCINHYTKPSFMVFPFSLFFFSKNRICDNGDSNNLHKPIAYSLSGCCVLRWGYLYLSVLLLLFLLFFSLFKQKCKTKESPWVLKTPKSIFIARGIIFTG